MKPIFINKLILSAVAGVFALASFSCSEDKETPPPFDDSPTFMAFSFSLDKSDMVQATRGDGDNDDWGDDFKPSDYGFDFDNFVDQMNFRPVIYKVESNGSLTPFVNITPLTLMENTDQETSTKKYFSFTGMFPADENKGTDYNSLQQSNSQFRLMIFANGQIRGEDDSNIRGEKLSFSLIGNEGKPGFTSVPMWGVKEFNFKNLKKGEALPVGEIPLLRAMAMVKVFLADEDEYQSSVGAPRDAVDLVSLSVNRYNANGYFAPQLWNKLPSTDDHTNDFSKTKNPFVSAVSGYSIKVGKPVDTDTDTRAKMEVDANGTEVYYNNVAVNREMIVFYIPEIDNNNGDPLMLTIGYSTHGGETRYSTFPFRNLNAGKEDPKGDPITPGESTDITRHWHIVRNHIYEYKITGVQDSKITVEARVKDWQYHKSSVDLEE